MRRVTISRVTPAAVALRHKSHHSQAPPPTPPPATGGSGEIIYSSRYPSVLAEIDQHRSFHEFFAQCCAKFADKTAFVCGVTEEKKSYSDVLKDTDAFARVLFHQGHVRPGHVVAIFSPNSVEYASIFHGALALGAAVTTMNPSFTPSEIQKQLELSDARVVVTIKPLVDIVRAAVTALEAGDAKRRHKITVLVSTPQLLTTGRGLATVPASEAHCSRDPNGVIVLPFSSGTTGLPKGVQLTNRNLVSNLLQTESAIWIGADSVMMAILPYFHIYGMMAVLHLVIKAGAAQVVMPKFEMVPYLRLLEKHKASHLFVAPPVVVGLVKHPMTQTVNRDCVRTIMSGAAPLGADVQKMCEGLFPHAKVIQGYGLTETSPVISATPHAEAKLGSGGVLAADTELRFVSPESGKDASPGGEGELWVRGPQVMKGYLRAEDTRLVMRPGGWFATGDIGHVDRDGYLFITDRLKELIKYKGFQVAPAELEALLLTHPFIADALVVGVPVDDGSGDEVPTAHVVLKPTVTAEERAHAAQAVIDFVASKVSHYKQLRGGVRVVDSVPKSPSGKLLRRIVRAAEIEALRHPKPPTEGSKA